MLISSTESCCLSSSWHNRQTRVSRFRGLALRDAMSSCIYPRLVFSLKQQDAIQTFFKSSESALLRSSLKEQKAINRVEKCPEWVESKNLSKLFLLYIFISCDDAVARAQ